MSDKENVSVGGETFSSDCGTIIFLRKLVHRALLLGTIISGAIALALLEKRLGDLDRRAKRGRHRD